jgi:hypothetical protein
VRELRDAKHEVVRPAAAARVCVVRQTVTPTTTTTTVVCVPRSTLLPRRARTAAVADGGDASAASIQSTQREGELRASPVGIESQPIAAATTPSHKPHVDAKQVDWAALGAPAAAWRKSYATLTTTPATVSDFKARELLADMRVRATMILEKTGDLNVRRAMHAHIADLRRELGATRNLETTRIGAKLDALDALVYVPIPRVPIK